MLCTPFRSSLTNITFLISHFYSVPNVVFFLLGDSPLSEFYVPTFRNTVCGVSRKNLPAHTTYENEKTRCSETSAHKIQPPGIAQKEGKEYNNIALIIIQSLVENFSIIAFTLKRNLYITVGKIYTVPQVDRSTLWLHPPVHKILLSQNTSGIVRYV